MAGPSLATEAAAAGNYPLLRFNNRERKLLQTVKTYVDSVSPEQLITTQGDLIVGDSGGVAIRLAKGAANTVLIAGASTVAYGSIVNANVDAAAAIAYSKLNLALGIVDADVSASAALSFSKLAALPSAQILVGSSGNVATATAVTGDISISNTGVTAITAGSLIYTDFNTDDSVKHTARWGVGFADLNAAGTGVAAVFSPSLPDKAVITKAWFHIKTTFAGNGDDGSTISIGLNTNTDLKAATAISDGTTWDEGFKDGVPVNTVATYFALTASRTLNVVWTAAGTDTALVAGSMYVFVEWVLSN